MERVEGRVSSCGLIRNGARARRSVIAGGEVNCRDGRCSIARPSRRGWPNRGNLHESHRQVYDKSTAAQPCCQGPARLISRRGERWASSSPQERPGQLDQPDSAQRPRRHRAEPGGALRAVPLTILANAAVRRSVPAPPVQPQRRDRGCPEMVAVWRRSRAAAAAPPARGV
jgi:hypothetical protein